MVQLEIMPQPPERENKPLVWPDWPLKLRTSSSQEEGCDRDFAVITKRAVEQDGAITALVCARVDWAPGEGGRMIMTEIPNSEFILKADLVRHEPQQHLLDHRAAPGHEHLDLGVCRFRARLQPEAIHHRVSPNGY